MRRIAALALFCCTLSTASAAPKNVLILHSYRAGYDWTDEISRGLRHSFEEAGDYALWFEFLDARRNNYPSNATAFRDKLVRDHANRKFDLIIVSDDEALDFLTAHAKGLFGSPPVVFCGINEHSVAAALPRDRFTGILETIEAGHMVSLAKRLRPQARHLYFVADSSPFGSAMAGLFESTTAQTPGLSFHLLDGRKLSLAAIHQAVATLPADSLLFLAPFRQDMASRYVSADEGERALAQASPVPVFGAAVSRAGPGILMGTMNYGFQHGQLTAQSALQILNGANPASIPLRSAGAFHLVFDHHEMKRWNIDDSQLPPEAQILNRPPSVWIAYRPWIIGGAAFALLQLVVISALIVNIVRRRKIQADLEVALRKTKDADALKGRFIANMSHELRTPMNGVLGLLQILQSTRLEPEQREYVSLAATSARSLLTLLNDILDLSQIEAGHLRIASKPFSLHDELQRIGNMFWPSTVTTGVTLRYEIHPSVPPVLIGDGDRLSQVLINLTANALKFTQRGAVRIEILELARTSQQTTLRFEVHDSGIGIAPEQMERIFDPFVQADATASRKFGGAGLGLAISRELVRKMGGEIGGRSTPGQGSTFWFEIAFPYQLEPIQQPLPAKPDTPRFDGRVVLLVEDNAVNRLVALKMLDRTGCRVILAEDGQECLAQLPKQPIDLILMDVQMPGMSGIDATRHIRLMDPPIRNIPIIALTASSMVGDREECLAAGMNAYLSKPIAAESLMQALAQFLPPAN